MYLLAAFPFLEVSSFNYFELFSFVPFYFHKSIVCAFNNLTIFKSLHLVENKLNLKIEIRLTALSAILFFLNYKLLL
jgi:hypothetical protein